MSTDTVTPAGDIRADRRTVADLLLAADKDTDAVSVFAVGSTLADTDAAMFVVKGREAIEYLHALCTRQGLLTDKTVTGQACSLQRPWGTT